MTHRLRTAAAVGALASYLLAGMAAGGLHVHPVGTSCGAGASACGHGHVHPHEGHSHDHDHCSHTSKPAEQTADEPQTPSPAHDESQCEICRFIALSVLPLPVLDLPTETGATSAVAVHAPVHPFLDAPRTHLSRGPPLG